MKVIVICGGNSAEKEISVKSGLAIFSAVKKKYKSEILFLKDDFSIIDKHYENGDIIFNALHGGYGEDGKIQSFFEARNYGFIGSNSKSCKIAIDKTRCKFFAKNINIPVPFSRIYNQDLSVIDDFDQSFVIKPNTEGSSVGFRKNLSKIKALKFLEKNKHKEMMIEELIIGREITVSILGNSVLPIVEIIPKDGTYDYESKYTEGLTSYFVPADIESEITSYISRKTMQLFQEIGCKDYARFDYILSKDNKPFFLEANTYPGMTKTSLFPKSAASLKMDFDSLIYKLISMNEK